MRHAIVPNIKNGGVSLREEDVVVSNVRLDLTCGRHNLLESIKFFKITEVRISPLLLMTVQVTCFRHYQDMIVRVYSKKPELVEMISEAFENFQLRTYGIKAQVHATPE